jgi:hypothetical protein
VLAENLIKGFSKAGALDRANKVYSKHGKINGTYVLNVYLETLLKYN